MCGIVFLHKGSSSEVELVRSATAALNRIAHRGPDEEGIECEHPAVMGHRRLSIIDISGSRQPMSDVTGRYVLAYNGEIYNYQQLRSRLNGHWQFRTKGDTEVLLAGLITFGPRFLRDAEGMWAFAFWDKQTKQLLLSRDRMGKKPLYYRLLPDGIACASEISALQALLPVAKWLEDVDSTADYFRYGFYLPGTTAYEDVHEVLPSHVFCWSADGATSSQAYWSLSVGAFPGSRANAHELVSSTLCEAVNRRLVSDVEVGAFLSGGVDSSLIVAILSDVCKVSPKTFTIGFSEPGYDEREFARLVARTYHTSHFEKCLQELDVELLKNLVTYHVGQPFADSSILPTALVSELAARHVKVALSGDGGDELFSGYQRYQARVILRWYSRLPLPLRKSVAHLISALPEPMVHHSRSFLKKAHLFIRLAGQHRDETPYVAPRLFSEEELTLLIPELTGRGHQPAGLKHEETIDGIQEMMVADALIYLPQDILVKVDRASMAYSLEARSPFLDRAVVELAFSLPREWHRRGFSGKRMLRESFPQLLPSKIWERRKQGFAVPVDAWFKGGLRHELQECLDGTDSPINASYVSSMLEENMAGRRDHGHRLWSVYIYLLWRQQLNQHAF